MTTTDTHNKVVYLEKAMLKSLSEDSKHKLLDKVTKMNVKIYDEHTAYKLLNYKKPLTIVRFGVIPLSTAMKLKMCGKTVISGDF